jgi:hypothetical protein
MEEADWQLTALFETLPVFHLVVDKDAKPESDEGEADRHIGRAGRGSRCWDRSMGLQQSWTRVFLHRNVGGSDDLYPRKKLAPATTGNKK